MQRRFRQSPHHGSPEWKPHTSILQWLLGGHPLMCLRVRPSVFKQLRSKMLCLKHSPHTMQGLCSFTNRGLLCQEASKMQIRPRLLRWIWVQSKLVPNKNLWYAKCLLWWIIKNNSHNHPQNVIFQEVKGNSRSVHVNIPAVKLKTGRDDR